MKYIVYLTTNKKSKINNLERIYVGVHKTENPDVFDGYIGCGVKINNPSTYKNPKSPFQYAVLKFGVEAFKRTTLYVFDTAKEAYEKEREIVNSDFISLSHTYNVCIGGSYEERYKPLYQFDYDGNLIKKWECSGDCYDFYGLPPTKWDGPKRNKCSFLNSYWSTSSNIDITEYSNKNITNTVYLYNKDGKLLKEFSTQTECAKYIGYDTGELSRAIKFQTLIKKLYYVSKIMLDQFIPTLRNDYIHTKFYVYNNNSELVGVCEGKELIKCINLHSWDYIHNIFYHNNNWYKDFYISLSEISKVPSKKRGRGICIDIYDNNNNFIETLPSIKEVVKKYKIPRSKITNIKQGDRCFNNYIFKYSK